MRYRCRKPVYEWRMWVVKLKARHHLFAKCFWPIYTWRKHTRATTLARQKSRFLVRVLDVYIQLRNFRCAVVGGGCGGGEGKGSKYHHLSSVQRAEH